MLTFYTYIYCFITVSWQYYIWFKFYRHRHVQRPRLPTGHKGAKLWQFDMLASFGHIFTAHAQKRLFRSFQSKISPRHSPRRPRFPIRHAFPLPNYVYRIYSMFCATTLHDLVTLTFDLLTSRMFHIQCLWCPPDPHTNFDYPTTIGYWVTITEFDHISVIWNSPRACSVARDL